MKKLPLTGKYGKGKFTLIDDADFVMLSKYTLNLMRIGYVSRNKGTAPFAYLHRLLLKAKKGEMVDHINGDKLDNRRANLRLASPAGNARNQRKRPNTSSIYKGVSWLKANSKWEANIHVANKKRRLGLYLEEKEAARAYNKAAQELFGAFALLNSV